MAKIALGMSGGVDSSIAVHLLQAAGWDVIGIHLQLVDVGGSVQAAEDAHRAADFFNIPLHVVSAHDLFQAEVVDPFIDAYRHGETPNPCVRCNRTIKFFHMRRLADDLGCEYLATGHYAKVRETPDGVGLFRAADKKKDQSYFLYGLPYEDLRKTVFPLGDYRKEEIRALAADIGLALAAKKDSQDICFIPQNDYASWLRANVADLPEDGDFLDGDGKVLGSHGGFWRYTIGQRKGLGIALGKPAYVCDIDAARGAVTLGDADDLLRTELAAGTVNWLTANPPAVGRGEGKIRSRGDGDPCRWSFADRTLQVFFNRPVRAVTPGQSIVLYDGDRVLGGGIIE